MSTEPKGTALVTAAIMRAWMKERARIEAQIAELEERRAKIDLLISTSASLEPRPQSETVQAVEPAKKRRQPRRAARRRVVRARRAARPAAPAVPTAETWRSMIKSIVYREAGPVSYSTVRTEIGKLAEAQGRAFSEKSFHSAVGRLAGDNEVVRHNAHLFTPDAFKLFQEQLAAGDVKDLKAPNPAHHSPMGAAIEKMMRKRPHGAESGHIIWELCKTPEFAQQITKNKTHPYNVLRRMVVQGDLVKRGKRYFHPRPDSETPATNAAGVSGVTGEAATSLFESSEPGRASN